MEAVESGYERRLRSLAYEFHEEMRRSWRAHKEEVAQLAAELDACRRDKEELQRGITDALRGAVPDQRQLEEDCGVGGDGSAGRGMAVVELLLSGGVVWPGDFVGVDGAAVRRVTDEVRRDVARAAGLDDERVLVRDLRTAVEILLLGAPHDPPRSPPPGAGACRLPADAAAEGTGVADDAHAAAARLVADAADPAGTLLRGGQTWRTVRAVLKTGRIGPARPVWNAAQEDDGPGGARNARQDRARRDAAAPQVKKAGPRAESHAAGGLGRGSGDVGDAGHNGGGGGEGGDESWPPDTGLRGAVHGPAVAGVGRRGPDGGDKRGAEKDAARQALEVAADPPPHPQPFPASLHRPVPPRFTATRPWPPAALPWPSLFLSRQSPEASRD